VRFHHMCIVTVDLEASIRMWCDLLGFEVKARLDLPGEENPDLERLMNDSFESDQARSKMAWLASKDGALIELQEPQEPAVALTPAMQLRYRTTGIHELGLVVDDIDSYFHKVVDAGYATQTDYIWQTQSGDRSFLFYDHEGNQIQLWQTVSAAAKATPAVVF
jgi:catechol 2,3-dioxygenase-like lactoylglutathione lyase family enzyme